MAQIARAAKIEANRNAELAPVCIANQVILNKKMQQQ